MTKNKYIKNILKILSWPIIFIIGQFLIKYIFTSIFNSNIKGDYTTKEFINYINTNEYRYLLNEFINKNSILIMLIIFIIFVPLFYKVYKKYRKKTKLKGKNIFITVLLGISTSLIFNITLFNLNNIIHITNSFDKSGLSLLTQIICSGLLGPILEELLFRGIVYEKLKLFNNQKAAMIITSIMFALFHNNFINAIYAFCVSFELLYIYEKYKSIKYPIIMHIALNTTTVLMVNLITLNYLLFNTYILVVSVFIILCIKKYFKEGN